MSISRFQLRKRYLSHLAIKLSIHNGKTDRFGTSVSLHHELQIDVKLDIKTMELFIIIQCEIDIMYSKMVYGGLEPISGRKNHDGLTQAALYRWWVPEFLQKIADLIIIITSRFHTMLAVFPAYDMFKSF